MIVVNTNNMVTGWWIRLINVVSGYGSPCGGGQELECENWQLPDWTVDTTAFDWTLRGGENLRVTLCFNAMMVGDAWWWLVIVKRNGLLVRNG